MSKKIEPTVAMILEAASTGTPLGTDARAILRAALNHPDARGLFSDENARPWEPLNGRVYVGDELRQDWCGRTITGVVGRMDEDGDPWTAEGAPIGVLTVGTWYVRRAAQPLPPERDGVVLVPADGHKAITTKTGQEFARLTFTTKQDLWYGPNLAARPGDWVIQTTTADRLTPGTWRVADQ